LYTIITRKNGTVYADPITNVESYLVGELKTTEDVVVPGFRSRVAKGEVFNNPFYSFTERWDHIPGTFTTTCIAANLQPTDDYIGVVSPIPRVGNKTSWFSPSYSEASLITEACTACLAKVQRPEIDGNVFIAELRQSIQTLRSPLQGALAFLDSLRRGKFSAKSLADQHLLIIFGLLPFIRDLENALEALQKKQAKRTTVRGFAQQSDTRNSTRAWGWRDRTGTITATGTHSLKVRAYYMYELRCELSLPQKLGIRLDSLPSALWELTKLSFVVDWFINIGNLIAALEPKLEVRPLSQGYTVESTWENTEFLGPITQNATSWRGSGGGQRSTYTAREKYRKPANLGSELGITLTTRGLGIDQILASISLIVQRLGGIR
jgi:hypothetical protein